MLVETKTIILRAYDQPKLEFNIEWNLVWASASYWQIDAMEQWCSYQFGDKYDVWDERPNTAWFRRPNSPFFYIHDQGDLILFVMRWQGVTE